MWLGEAETAQHLAASQRFQVLVLLRVVAERMVDAAGERVLHGLTIVDVAPSPAAISSMASTSDK